MQITKQPASPFYYVRFFKNVVLEIGKHFNFAYLLEEDKNVTAHLYHVFNLYSNVMQICLKENLTKFHLGYQIFEFLKILRLSLIKQII
ncbi:MAG: hypothetical protein KGY75_07280 [Candidatus Cloacimonetes bacterium]|nr:hypothetical protein [Candidatus Cloacimonadota bacterium]